MTQNMYNMHILSTSGSARGGLLSPYGSLGAESTMAQMCRQLGKAGVDIKSWTHGAGPGKLLTDLLIILSHLHCFPPLSTLFRSFRREDKYLNPAC